MSGVHSTRRPGFELRMGRSEHGNLRGACDAKLQSAELGAVAQASVAVNTLTPSRASGLRWAGS